MAESTSAARPLVIDDFCLVSKEQIQSLLSSISELWDSSSDEGCESPYFVGDITHLKALRNLVGPLHELPPLGNALRLVNSDMDSRGEPVMLVIPTAIEESNLVELVDKAIVSASLASANGDVAQIDALRQSLAADGIAVATGIDHILCKPWNAECENEGPAQENCRER